MLLFKNKVILKQERRGKFSVTIFSDGTEYIGRLQGLLIEALCDLCNSKRNLKFYSALITKQYICASCRLSGENNPFFGKTHSSEAKSKISRAALARDISGENNPFYGKSHSKETKDKWASNPKKDTYGERNPFFGRNHSDETKAILSSKHKQWASVNKDLLRQNGLKCASRRIKKTLPEIKVEQWLTRNNIPYIYNKIIPNVGQFDFFVGPNILIEVHGDYWHCNPNKYPNGPINERQQYKIVRDLEKKSAISTTHKLLVIWEEEINNDDYSSLQELLNVNQI